MENSGFDLGNYSVNSGSPAAKENLVEIQTHSPKGDLLFKTIANSHIGYENLKPTVIFFELPKSLRLERIIAKGSTQATFVIHDVYDIGTTVTVTFPAIGLSSPMIKDLKGCR
jgi:hypothetical protein